MPADTHPQLANFIWGICNLLRGPYKRNEYRKVILPLTVLRRFDCLLAPTKEQVLQQHSAVKGRPKSVVRSVTEYLGCETASIDRMAAKVEAAIERLQEYRSALITAAVPGKIDVRGAIA